ncbi:hypothetical protein [Deinococcus sp.]|uniref:hypothetical protein n=1 Tax=Deinococcus sp. TaxID=47478 RepID=UPI0025FB151F|nr:hypothetical protein [Deinococcus sp.]
MSAVLIPRVQNKTMAKKFIKSIVGCITLGFATWSESSSATTSSSIPITFDSIMYTLFASPYADLSRDFVTSTPQVAAAKVRLPLPPKPPSGFTQLGVWTTDRALSERAVRPDPALSPAALIIHTRRMRVALKGDQGEGFAIVVGRWSGSPKTLSKFQDQLKQASYKSARWHGGIVFSRCGGNNVVLEDYPVLKPTVSSYCQAQLRTASLFIEVSAINLNENRAIAELKRNWLLIHP